MQDFANLHVHSIYSAMDGIATVEDLAQAAASMGQPALALTDHDVMYGVVPFYKACKGQGIKPIIGVEGRIVEDGERYKEIKPLHITLFAENEIGYKNLVQVLSKAHIDTFYYKPRIVLDELVRHKEGIIVSSACISGIVAAYVVDWLEALANGDGQAEFILSKVRSQIRLYKEIFEDRFYIEIMDVQVEKILHETLVSLASEAGVKLIATCDTHYLKQEDAFTHDAMRRVAMYNASEEKLNEMQLDPDFWLRSAEDIDLPEEYKTNTMEIVERCTLDFNLGKLHYPSFKLDDRNLTEEEESQLLVEKTKEGLIKHYPIITQSVIDRAQLELDVIISKHFAGYFLMVADVLEYARNSGYQLGPGRGSVAGSLVAYALEITSIDPLQFGLLFERFLNPERDNPPDIDMDFPPAARKDVINYVKDKYGHDKVAGIVTFSQFRPRSAFRDVLRMMNFTAQETNDIAKLVVEPDFTGDEDIEFDKLEAPFDGELLQRVRGDNPKVEEAVQTTKRIIGGIRHVGEHAAGILITPEPLVNYVPLQHPPNSKKDTEIDMVQFNGDAAASFGLLKMDFLGLKTLQCVEDTMRMVKERHDVTIDFDKVALDDSKVLELINTANTVGVFQIGTPGFISILPSIPVTHMKDLLDLVAIFRPGPKEFIGDYSAVKRGEVEAQYIHPSMKAILEPTAGILIYQEQIMRIVNELAGLSLGEAAVLIKAIGKKDAEQMSKYQAQFIAGTTAYGMDQAIADQIWKWVLAFAGYGFNAAHAASYGMLAWWTAYLKAYYPHEFIAASCNVHISDSDKLSELLGDCLQNKLALGIIDINESTDTFHVKEIGGVTKIIPPLSMVKGCSVNIASIIIEEREANGVFTDLFDIVTRLQGKRVTSGTLTALINAGALDRFKVSRKMMIEALPLMAKYFKVKTIKEKLKAEWEALLANPDDFKFSDKMISEVDLTGFWAPTSVLTAVATSEKFGLQGRFGENQIFSTPAVIHDLKLPGATRKLTSLTGDTPFGKKRLIMFTKEYKEYGQTLEAYFTPMVVWGSGVWKPYNGKLDLNLNRILVLGGEPAKRTGKAEPALPAEVKQLYVYLEEEDLPDFDAIAKEIVAPKPTKTTITIYACLTEEEAVRTIYAYNKKTLINKLYERFGESVTTAPIMTSL